jgi:DNA-binding transcriptional LysR family regulator
MDYFAAMHAFVRSVELGSFSKAAQESGMKVSTVSRHVASLEADLGAALFNRSTRRLNLTEAGRQFHQDAARILEHVAAARVAATSMNAQAQGLLRINVPIGFGRRHILPHLPDFLAAYPLIRIDATFANEAVDLIGSGADVAVRIGTLADSSLIARRLAPHRRSLVASPAYLAQHRPIGEPGDLQTHDCLCITLQPKDAWYFRQKKTPAREAFEVAVQGKLRANQCEVLLDAALAGLGVALLPTWLTYEAVAQGRLQVLLPQWEAQIAPGPPCAIWGIYPPKKIVPPKVRAFLSFLQQRLGEPPYWER